MPTFYLNHVEVEYQDSYKSSDSRPLPLEHLQESRMGRHSGEERDNAQMKRIENNKKWKGMQNYWLHARVTHLKQYQIRVLMVQRTEFIGRMMVAQSGITQSGWLQWQL